MNRQHNHFYEFGAFRLDPSEHILLRDGQHVPLTPKVFETLLILVENNGHVVDKDELLRKVWPDSFVEETSLAKNVSVLRKVLSESDSEQLYIETIPKHGYRFIAQVREVEIESADTDITTTDNFITKAIDEDKNLNSEQNNLNKLQVVEVPDASGRFAFLKSKTVLIFAIVLVVSLIIIVGYWQVNKSTNIQRHSEVKSIAVLPFKSLNANSDDEYLGLGMTDALIIKLGSLKHIIVRPTSAVLQYANQQSDLLATGQSLKVEAVLEGSIQRLGDRIRVTVQLVNVNDGRQIWADRFEERLTDIFAVQDVIATRVAVSLTARLTGEEQENLARRGTNNPEAFQLYVRGHFFANQETTEGFKKALEHLNKAIELDPNYALAYAALSKAYSGASEWHLPPREAMPKARAFAEQAIRLDETLPDGHVMLGDVKMQYYWDAAGAERELKRALELNPNHIGARSFYCWLLSGMGRHQEAIAEAKRVEEIDPLRFNVANYYFAGEYDQAISQAKKALEIDPNRGQVHQWLGMAYEGKGMYEEALASFQKAREIDDTPDFRAFQARVLALSGKRSKALKILAELKELSKQRYISPYFIAIIYTGLNDKDEAIAWLEKAYQDRSYWLTGMALSMEINPRLASLRDDPRFQDLLQRIGRKP